MSFHTGTPMLQLVWIGSIVRLVPRLFGILADWLERGTPYFMVMTPFIFARMGWIREVNERRWALSKLGASGEYLGDISTPAGPRDSSSFSLESSSSFFGSSSDSLLRRPWIPQFSESARHHRSFCAFFAVGFILSSGGVSNSILRRSWIPQFSESALHHRSSHVFFTVGLVFSLEGTSLILKACPP